MSKKRGKEIDVGKIDLEVLKKKTADLPALLEYAHSMGGFSIVPTEQGVIKGKSLQAMGEQTDMQLEMIYEQMKVLAKQAKTIKDRVEVSHQIYEADMKFEPVIGEHYFLYTKRDGTNFLSLIGPDQWKDRPFEYQAEVKLLADKTWKVIERDEDEKE